MSILSRGTRNDSGMGLYLTAAGLLTLLGLSALAVDMASYYLARSESQRAADAAALAGASVFVTSGCTGSTANPCSGAAVETAATDQAISVANQNLVNGESPNLVASEVSFNTSNVSDPQITVTVERTRAHGNPMPTYFAKALGFTSVDVSASATAEAYNPAGSSNGATLAVSCLKPWILPNCDPNNSTPANPNCPGAAYYIDPTTNAIEHPGSVSQGGVIGAPVTLKPGDPTSAPISSQYYPVQMCINSTINLLCPNCAGNISTGCTGASIYGQNIECCNGTAFICGSDQTIDLNLKTGNMQGPTASGVSCLIHESNQGTGQDTLCGTSVLSSGTQASCAPNLTIYGGSNNPNPALVGQQITTSDSVVSIPVYDGHALCSGSSCNGTISVMGFLQVFINSVDLQNQGTKTKGNVNATIMNISSCANSTGSGNPGQGGGGGSGSSGLVSGGGVSAIPVRLVSQ